MSPIVFAFAWVFLVTLFPTEGEGIIMLDRLKDRVAQSGEFQPKEVSNANLAAVEKKGNNRLAPIAVTGTGAGRAAFTGTFLPQTAQVTGPLNHLLAVVGTLTGTVVSATGAVLGTVTQTVNMIVNQASGTCKVLDLHLGALDVTLLGTDITLAPVDLKINANAVSGGLLGVLLCTVATLLGGAGLVTISTLPVTLIGLLAAVLAQVLALVLGLIGGLL